MRVQRDAVTLDPRDESPAITGVQLLPVASNASARNFGNLAQDIDSKLNTIWAHEEDRVRDRAQREGALAAERNPTMHMSGDSIEARAFNRGAAEVGARRLEIQARTYLDGLARDHGADPGQLASKAAEYRNGLMEGLPDTLRARFATAYDTLAGAYVSQARTQQDRQVAEERLASFNLALDGRISALERFGRASVGDQSARAAMEQELGNHTADLVALGPRSAFTFNGVNYPADPSRAAALTPVEMAQQVDMARDRVHASIAMGGYDAGPRSAAWIDAWERRELGPQGSGLRSEEVRRLSGMMRSDAAHRSALAREGQATARAQLQPLIEQNAQAVALTGAPVHTISDVQLRGAGMNPAAIAQFRAGENFQIQAATARNEVATASPEELAAIGQRFAPGTPLFAANPRGAAQIVEIVRGRETATAQLALQERVQDLTAQAAASGVVPAQMLTVDDGRAAGVTPERIAHINAQITEAAEKGHLTQIARTQSPTEVQATLDALPVAGDDAAENAARISIYQHALAERQQQLHGERAKPGDYVVANIVPVRTAFEEAGQDPAKLAIAMRLSLAEQERLGVPAERRQALPPMVADRMVAPILQLQTPGERVARLRSIVDAVETSGDRQRVLQALGAAGLPEGYAQAVGTMPRNSVQVAARLASELSAKVQDLNLPPETRRTVTAQVTATLADDDRLGALRAAQYEATGNRGFLTLLDQERESLSRVVSVRAAAAGDAGSALVRGAYQDLFGGHAVLNTSGVAISVPVGTDASRLTAGLNVLRDRAVTALLPEQVTTGGVQARDVVAQALRDGTWIDAEGGRFAFYPRNAPFPIQGGDGRPLLVTLEQALAAGADSQPQNDPVTLEQQRMLRESRRLMRQQRLMEVQP